MERLSAHLRAFLARQLAGGDPAWSHLLASVQSLIPTPSCRAGSWVLRGAWE